MQNNEYSTKQNSTSEVIEFYVNRLSFLASIHASIITGPMQ